MNEKTTASVAILPFPLTPAALFGYGILRFLGHISENTHARFTHASGHHADLFHCGGKVVDLRVNIGNLHDKLLELVSNNHGLRRMLTFASFGEHEEMYSRLESMLKTLGTEDSRRALSSIYELVNRLLQTNSDTWKSVNALTAFTNALGVQSLLTKVSTSDYPSDQRKLSLPAFKNTKGAVRNDDEIKGSFEVTLHEGRIYSLVGKHIGIVVGGPPNSGKSTFAVSLVTEIRNCIWSLQSRKSFADLRLGVGLSTLDVATPTTNAIYDGWADTGREKLISLKQPWTPRLAKTAQQSFINARERLNIVIGDLPGRVDDITKFLIAPADAAIIVSNDWSSVQGEWNPLMQGMGVPVVSKVRSRGMNEGFSSLVTSWNEGQRLNGRVVALNRTQKSWDLFIQWLALFLLFDVLPTQFGEESKKKII